MERDEAIKLIEKKALEILKANGYEDDGLCGRIIDGCEDWGSLGVYWPMINGETVGLYADEIMGEGKSATEEEIASLVPGYQTMQLWIQEITEQL